jgi:serine/threonine-protein kinase
MSASACSAKPIGLAQLMTDLRGWNLISDLFDEVVELPEVPRAQRLAAIRADSPAAARQLEALLASLTLSRHDAFLARPVARQVGSSDASAPGLKNTRLGAYTLTRRLGEGGSGSVWLAHAHTDADTGADTGRRASPVAIKLLHLSLAGPAGAADFAREATILRRLADRNIVKLLGAGRAPWGQPYLVLEYLEGEPIDAHCRRRRLTVGDRLALFSQLVSAVRRAHRAGVVHGDIKCANTLVTVRGHVKLLDFGIARPIRDGLGAGTALPGPCSRRLSLEAAAPEQLLGRGATCASDVYALGVMLYRLLAGSHPTAPARPDASRFARCALVRSPRPLAMDWRGSGGARGCRPLAKLGQHMHECRTGSRALARALEGELSRLAERMVAKSPSVRQPDAAALAADLRRYFAGASARSGMALKGRTPVRSVSALAVRRATTPVELAYP